MVPSLSQQLDHFLSGVLSRTDARTAEALSRLQTEMATGELLEGALKAGDSAPDFTLPAQDGRSISLSEKLSHGAVVLTFFRGGWCPFCTITLRALQQIARSVERSGASLVAISPQPLDALATLADSQGLTFPLLSDHCNAVARSYGLLWRLDPSSQAIYQRLGHDIPSHNGAPGWELPMPAGYVIAPDSRIVHARVDARVTHRLEPAEVLNSLRELRGQPVG